MCVKKSCRCIRSKMRLRCTYICTHAHVCSTRIAARKPTHSANPLETHHCFQVLSVGPIKVFCDLEQHSQKQWQQRHHAGSETPSRLHTWRHTKTNCTQHAEQCSIRLGLHLHNYTYASTQLRLHTWLWAGLEWTLPHTARCRLLLSPATLAAQVQWACSGKAGHCHTPVVQQQQHQMMMRARNGASDHGDPNEQPQCCAWSF